MFAGLAANARIRKPPGMKKKASSGALRHLLEAAG
jgi:hypothetical protein